MSEKPRQKGAKTPELDMLNEIMDRAMPHIPDPPEEDKKKETTALPAPGKNKRSSVYIYLAVLFGAAFLMLLLAYFVQQRNSAAVRDDLRSTAASRQELLEDIQRLESETSRLTRQVDDLERQLEKERGLSAQVETLDGYLYARVQQVLILNNFWYVHQLMEDGDYAMAAVAADKCRTRCNSITGDIYFSLPVMEQFEQDCQTLIDRGYLSEQSNGSFRVSLPEHLRGEKAEETLTALWDVLDGYYCTAYQYTQTINMWGDIPIQYFDAFGGSEYTFISENCGPYTLRLYRQMIDGMVEIGQLQWENGRLAPGPNHGTGVLYSFPEYDPTR